MFKHQDEWAAFLSSPEGEAALQKLYPDAVEAAKTRILSAIARFCDNFGPIKTALFSAPGSLELCGSYTDRQHGQVLSAAVGLDTIAVVSPNPIGIIHLVSEHYDTIDPVALHNLLPQPEERGKSISLVRGMVGRLREVGYEVGGFDVYTTSELSTGTGISASSAFDTLIGSIVSYLFNNGGIPPVEIARAGQYVENVYFGKSNCGLCEQISSAQGGFIRLDGDTSAQLEGVSFPGYSFCVVDTGKPRRDYLDPNQVVAKELALVAGAFGVNFLRDLTEENFLARLPALRPNVPDRALLRALHYFEENNRVLLMTDALINRNAIVVLDTIRRSGHSSLLQLQNAFPPAEEYERKLTLALALCKAYVGDEGAARIHGSGFEGAVTVFLPCNLLHNFCAKMSAVFGAHSAHPLTMRSIGATPFPPAAPGA